MDTPKALRPKLVAAALPHVMFDGWTAQALAHAARDLGVEEGVARLAFPGGGIEMLEEYMRMADTDMRAGLEARLKPGMKIREKIALAIKLRLQDAAPHREAVLRGLRMLALPQHAALGARSLWRTSDIIWRAIGDRSTDFNYYSKRAILSGVYSSTLLFWLNDNSEDFAETWAFLDRRIDNVMQFEKVKAQARDVRASLPDISRFLSRLRYPPA